jgi:hypothetical protein
MTLREKLEKKGMKKEYKGVKSHEQGLVFEHKIIVSDPTFRYYKHDCDHYMLDNNKFLRLYHDYVDECKDMTFAETMEYIFEQSDHYTEKRNTGTEDTDFESTWIIRRRKYQSFYHSELIDKYEDRIQVIKPKRKRTSSKRKVKTT